MFIVLRQVDEIKVNAGEVSLRLKNNPATRLMEAHARMGLVEGVHAPHAAHSCRGPGLDPRLPELFRADELWI